MSKIIDLYGNLARDVELRYSQSGTPWTTISVAESNKDRDGNPKPTTWWTVKLFGQQAEDAAGLRKGQRVKVEGRIETEEWSDRETGEKRSRLVVIAWPRDGFTIEGPHAPTARTTQGTSYVRASDGPTPQNDPWAAPSPGGARSEEAPF